MTTAFLRRRLILRPSSSSEETKSESESDAVAAGGVASRLRKLDLAFEERFLNVTCGRVASAVVAVVVSSAILIDILQEGPCVLCEKYVRRSR